MNESLHSLFYTFTSFVSNRTRDSESQHLQNAKQSSQTLEKQTAELEKADNFPESSNTETSKRRMQLLKHNNEIIQSDERNYQFEFKIEK